MLELGRYSLWAALAFSLASVLFLALGMLWDRKDLLRNGYYAVYAFFLASVVASAVLLQAFLKKDFSFGYVAENSAASLSTFYRIAGFWAGQQGSFLLWLLLIAVVAVVIALLDLNKVERITGGAVMVMCSIGGVFVALMVLDTGSNPFVAAEAGTQPFGLNPLLLHPAMVLHPPALFIGYVGLAVPFAFGVSTLLLGRADRLWVTLSQKWAVAGWLFLSLGIGLGAWWAYVVLSFGGYWGWDPVENTSLVPWLTATALLHAFTLYKSRGLFKHWALGLAAATFWFTILATWTTRTGLIQSVHAFEKNPLLVWILSGFLVVTAVATIALMAWRWRLFQSHDQVESILSRDFL
ncbi:MAG: cytochrome c biogenesis protein CcsA, partial [Actinobacteria bacterium]|nr:cytochrome c biogenesis protein CcsA [Actinomycetota bacterium]